MLLFDGEGQLLTYLNCTCAWGSWLYFRLHYKVLPAMYQVEHVRFMNNMFMYLVSHRTALASHSTSPRCSLPHPQKKPRYSSLSMPTEVDTCCIHYYGFSDTSNSYHEGKSQCTRVITTEKVAVCCGLVWSLRWLPSMSFFLRQLVEMRPGVGMRRVDVLLWSSRIAVRVSQG